MMKRTAALAALLAAPLSVSETAAAETRVSFASGVDYSSGSYGDVMDTEVVSVPLAVRVTSGKWSFRASVPYLSITGPADVAEEDGGGTAPPGPIRVGTESGFGDTTLSATRSFTRLGGSRAYFDVTGRVRLPSGDEERGLGVGTTDYALLGELGNSNEVGGVYVNGGRRFLGDRTGVERQDGWQAGAGGWLRAGEQTRVGVFYSRRDASIEGNEAPQEAGAYVSYRFSDTLRVSINASGGLSEASPDIAGGFRLTWRPEARDR
ncbi:MAG: hypothetical protein ABL883_11480 [Terricaulis sp.]